jgi:short-subunit dehydrogenase
MLLREGVSLWGTSRDPGRLAQLAQEFSTGFTAVALDLGDAASAESAYLGAAAQAGGAFDLVINNAGYGVFGEFGATPAADWRAQVEGMLGTTLVLSHAAYSSMRAGKRGCLVNVSSMAAEFPLPFMSGYNVSKAGLSALSESLLFESRGSPIKVIDFRPGDYRTAFNTSMHRSTAATGPDRRTENAWRKLEGHLLSAPEPGIAARDLRRAFLRGRRGIVRSGTFFQVRVAPLLARLAPSWLVRNGTAWYFGST